MKTIIDAKRAHTNAFYESWKEGGGCPLEGDEMLNYTAHEVIRAYKDEFGAAWLGKINLYAEDKGKPPVWEWDGGQVYNFGACFVLPAYDAEIERLIKERDAAPYTGTKDDYARVDAITALVEQRGGDNLIWS